MARVFITGSSDGLGLLAGQRLLREGHAVTLHARSERRAAEARAKAPGVEGVLIGDFATIAGMRRVVAEANASGPFDAVIHNAGIGYQIPQRVETADGLEETFAVNVLAPYLLTTEMTPPKRLVYLTSGLNRGGSPSLEDPQWKHRRWDGMQAYSDSKLYDVTLAFAFARRWGTVRSNAVDPGWVATKMGGPGAPDDLQQGAATQAWLAVSDDPGALVSGHNFYHQRWREPHPAARDVAFQDELLAVCASLTGVAAQP
jgi:NAD(P)-dependent dehydrogenase (short-subunit alcohol dehydrogenase family)